MSEAKQQKGRLIAFEGVDGAGKTTVLSLVAAGLRARGYRVHLPREGKEHRSRPTRMIRKLTRDQRNFELSARSELLLYCAREAQILEEEVRPALARGETVLIDRSLLTPLTLGRARGLPETLCEELTEGAAAGLHPDLTLVFDVDPRTSRIRKRLESVRTHTLDVEGGRKGLAGSAFKARVRDYYLQLAQRRSYPVVHAEQGSPAINAERVLAIIEGEASALEQPPEASHPMFMVSPELSFADALDVLPPSLALYFSEGLVAGRSLRQRAREDDSALAAWAMDLEDPLREALVSEEPEYCLKGYARRPYQGDQDLRMRLLLRAPDAVLRALRYVHTGEVDQVRAEYVSSHPDGVLRSLSGREDQVALELRNRAWKKGSDDARSSSLQGCHGAAAWKLRESLYEKHPVYAVRSLHSVTSERGDTWLQDMVAFAPKRVLAALGGRTDGFAHDLRRQLFETGSEVISSLRGLSDDASYELRTRAVSEHPSTVIHSLFGLPDDERKSALIAQATENGRGDMHVLRRLQGLREWSSRPDWARAAAEESGGR